MATLKQARKTIAGRAEQDEYSYSPYREPDTGAPQQPAGLGGFGADVSYALGTPSGRRRAPVEKTRSTYGGGGAYAGAATSVPSRAPTQTTQVTETSFKPAGPRPTFETPDYEKVEYDKRRVASLRQRKAAPFRREAIKALQGAFTRSYGSKPERDMAIRNALNQYGTAYGKLLVQAEGQAEKQYERELQDTRQERLLEFQAAMVKAQATFRSSWEAWVKGGTQTTTTRAETGPMAPGGGGGYFQPYVQATTYSGRVSRKDL